MACGGGGNHKIAGSVVAPPTTARRLPRCAAPQTHPNFVVLFPGGALATGGTCGLLRAPLLPTGGVHMLWSGLALRGPPMVLRELHSASCSSACVLSPPRVQARQVVHTRCVNLKYIPRSQGAYAVGFSGNMAVLCASRDFLPLTSTVLPEFDFDFEYGPFCIRANEHPHTVIDRYTAHYKVLRPSACLVSGKSRPSQQRDRYANELTVKIS